MIRRLLPFCHCRNGRLGWLAIAIAVYVAITAPYAHGQTAQMAHISVTARGKGAPVVLIPGLSSPGETWAGVAAGLAATHRVLVVQINGCGGDAPRANLQPGILAGAVSDLDAYLAKEHAQGAAVVGHSMGGLIALMLAKAHPADVSRLMIVDALPWIGTLFGAEQVAQVEGQGRALRDQMAALYGKPNPANDQAVAARNALKPDSQAKIAGWSAKADARVSGQALYEDLTTDLRGDLAGIAPPITLVVPFGGAVGQAQAEAIYRAAYASAPHFTLVAVPDSGHFAMLDQPAAFDAVLEQFLAH
jgi:pimeloyl-ACP methyl ester carboxylesterase